MEDRAQSSLIALRRILRATEDSTRLMGRATGLSGPQRLVMQFVEEAREATPKSIAAQAKVAPATATALIEKLAQRGFVTRRRSERDRRQYWVSLTQEGRAALWAAPDPLHRRFSQEFADMPSWEQAMIVAALERVADLVTRAGETAGSAEAQGADTLGDDPFDAQEIEPSAMEANGNGR
jgi:DNA-binding MarR family transcriptional regulator